MCDLRGKPHTHSQFLVGIISKSYWLPRAVRIRKNGKGEALLILNTDAAPRPKTQEVPGTEKVVSIC